MRNRTSKPGTKVISTLEEIDVILKDMAINETFINEQTALMNQQLISVRESYEPDIKKRLDENERLSKSVETYLKKNKSIFERIRSKVLTFGKVGFQIGKKHLGKSKDVTWVTITDNLFNAYGGRFVKVKKTLLKTGLLDAIEKGEISVTELENFGATVIQKDRPFYKLFLEKISNKK